LIEQLKVIASFLSLLAAPAFVAIVLIASIGFRRGRGFVGNIATPRATPVADLVADIVGTGLCLMFMAALISSLVFPNYPDHIEPLMAAISWLDLRGFPVHPSWSLHEELYGSLYGPVLYQLNALSLSALPTIAGSKLLGLLMPVIAAVLQYFTFRRVVNARVFASRFAVMTVVIASNTPNILTNRPEPFLYMLVSLSLFATVTFRTEAIALVIGLATGIAANMKLHALFYFLPPAAMLVAAQEGRRTRCLLIGTLSAAAGAFLPFALPGTSLGHYTGYLLMASQHGLSGGLLGWNLTLGCALLALPAGAYGMLWPRLTLPDFAFLCSFAASIAIVAIIASKPGSGEHHLIPFVPVALFGTARIFGLSEKGSSPAAPASVLKLLYMSTLLTFGVASFLVDEHIVKTVVTNFTSDEEKRSDLLNLFAKHPDGEMGVTDEAHYTDTFFYPALVMRGGKFHFAPAAWMDLKQGGVSGRYPLELLDHCRVRAWILPALGKPFSLPNYYTDTPLMSKEFVATFYRNYARTDRSRYYDLWTCKAGS
jgi:hypothetical protein